VEAVITAFEEQLVGSEDESGWRLERLAERAGIGIGSFYEYFSNKDSLLGALVGNVTERNFKNLLAVVDKQYASLDVFAHEFCHATTRAYLARPQTTRVVIAGIGRFGLFRFVIQERDRFVVSLASRVHQHMPHVPLAEVEDCVRLACDAGMGHITSELARHAKPDVEACGRRLTVMTLAMLRDVAARANGGG
jgi:AcrR family transcriptional regulator